MQKKATIYVASFFLLSLFLVGFTAIAAEVGGKSDPLVTVSYLNSLGFQDAINKAVDEKTTAKLKEIDARLDAIADNTIATGVEGGDISSLVSNTDFINKVAAEVAKKTNSTQTASSSVPATFKLVDIKAGTSIKLDVGTQVLHRIGTVTVNSPNNPGLVDMTDGKTIDNGGSLLPNHLYISTLEGRTIKATTDSKVFLMGGYN